MNHHDGNTIVQLIGTLFAIELAEINIQKKSYAER